MSLSAGYPVLYLDQWEGVTPVLLPVGSLTLSCINDAIIGVSVPFFIFLVSMFYLLMPIWLDNFHSDKALNQQQTSGNLASNIQQQKGSDAEIGGYMYAGDSSISKLGYGGQEADPFNPIGRGGSLRVF